MRPTLRSVALVFLLSISLHNAYADLGCPPAIKSTPGNFPLDYNDPDNKGHILYLVEVNHFTSSVETLQHGDTGSIGVDLSYVLNAFPNHPRALNAMARLAEKDHTLQPYGAKYSIECYFQRAMDFAPTDPTPPMLYAIYLASHGKDQEALQNYQLSEKIEPDNPNLQYNMGLLYFKMKEYDKSLEYAHKAYDGGFPLPGLRQKLQKAGVWKNE
jgi:tetratricopeptide (TPR) repeat protein